MPLSVGDKLGPYEILAPIGKGGMGEVYRTRDTKLDREFSTGRALVMELVPGGTLAGTLPLETALNYARQIAEALEAAHDKNIIHRDLKPANIMVTPVGVVKVLDFGLAAVTQPSTAGKVDPSNSPTLTMRATQAGMILGTAGYMAPEQAAGQLVDRRADIWAFGVVLYEMLTAQRLFTGDSIAHILADVLRAPIDFDKLPKETPRAIRELLKRCLDRDVRTRLRDIGEARIAIQNVGKEPDVNVSGALPSRLGRLPWIAAAVLAVAVAGLGFELFRAARPPELTSLIRLNVDLEDSTPLVRGGVSGGLGGNMLALSPDGTRLALTLRGADGKVRLHTRLLNQSQVTSLAGTENAYSPFFSPAGDWIAFFAEGKLKKIAVEGGAAVTLCDAPEAYGGSWSDDGNIIATLSNPGALSRVLPTAGRPCR